MTLDTKQFGPFVRGVVDGANPALPLDGALKYARNAFFDGLGRLKARPGTQVAMTLKDDQGVPANITSVLAITAFGDGALAVGHSSVTSKFYLYRFNSDLSGWFNSGGVLQSNLNAQPAAVLWTGAPSPAKVLIAEGLGEAFIAHNEAGTTFRSKRYSVSGGLLNLDADLRGSGVEQTFFRGLVSFQQHLWGWGYGSEAAADNDRPELLRFGFPIFGTVSGGYFAQADSVTVGHRVRSYRDRVVSAVVAGQVLYVGTNSSLWPVIGFGRDSWDKSRALDNSYGFAGPYSAVEAANGVLYYWSTRGPMRASGLSEPEPLWDAIPVAAAGVVNATDIVAVFDPDRDQVMWLYQNQTSGRVSVLAAVDVRRNVMLGPDGDIGLGVRCAGYVQPIGTAATAGPSGPPTTPSTTNVGNSVATANLVAGDTSPGVTTVIEYKRTADSIWTVAAEIPGSVTSYQITGLLNNTAYHWRAKHRRNGQDSTYLGPVAATTFSTTNTLLPPTNCGISQVGDSPCKYRVVWTNSGEVGVSTEVYGGFVGQPLLTTAAPGVSSYVHDIGSQTGEFCARVRHVKVGATSSPFSNTACVTIS